MPRPKKAKVASAATRVAKTSKPADHTPRETQPTRASKRSTAAAAQPLDAFSDDSDGLVVKTTRTRSQPRMPWQPEPQKDVDFTMTGALAIDDAGTDALSPAHRTPHNKTFKRTRNSLEGSGKSSTRQTPASSLSKRGRSTRSNAHGTPAQEEDSSGFGDHLLSFTSLGSESPAHGTRPPSRIGATPAHETSVLALTNFKRRPRQPSLLRMVQQTTDVEDNDLEDFEFEDFLPDAESTPVHVQKAAPGEITGNDSGVNLSSSGSRGKKRKLSPVVQVPRSSPPYDADADVDANADAEADAESSQLSSPISSPELPEIIYSTERARDTQEMTEPDAFSETMAPPMSSSDYENNVVDDPQPSRRTARKARGASTKAASDTESEGEATDRPRQAKGRRKTKPNPGLSTAKLQSMLPRRRAHVRQAEDEFDVPLEEDDSDVDELAMPQRRHTATKKSAAPKTKKKARAAKKPAAKPARQNIRTYGRRPSSDKENEDAADEDVSDGSDDEDTIEASTANKPSKAMELMAKQFEEVDEFELDFESVSYVQTSSPPR